MMYNTQNDWGSGLCPSSGFLRTKSTTFLKPDFFPFSDDGRKTPTLLGLLERANLDLWSSLCS
jgi:hypothetical protein